MSREAIYRMVDVRALSKFHSGQGGLSVNAERVWTRLLIDEITTPVPGLILARRGDMVDRCRMVSKQFDEAFAELSGGEDPMAIADWPIGVIVLPSAPRQPIHAPRRTSNVVEWARFFSRQAPRCPLVARLRDDWRTALSAQGQVWIDAFDNESRGPYQRPPKASPDGSPNTSPERSPKASPTASPNISPNASQETGDRRQKKSFAADAAPMGKATSSTPDDGATRGDDATATHATAAPVPLALDLPQPAARSAALPFTCQAASDAVAEASGGRYTKADVASEWRVNIARLIRQHPLEDFEALGAYLATDPVADRFPPGKGPSWLATNKAVETFVRALEWRFGSTLKARPAPSRPEHRMLPRMVKPGGAR